MAGFERPDLTRICVEAPLYCGSSAAPSVMRYHLDVRSTRDHPQFRTTESLAWSSRVTYAVLGLAGVVAPSDDPWLSLTLRGLGVALIVCALLRIKLRLPSSLLVAFSLLAFAPSYFGERSGVASIATLLIASVLAATLYALRRAASRRATRAIQEIGNATVILVPALMALYWLIIYLNDTAVVARPLVAYYALIAVALVLLRLDVDLIAASLRLFAVAISVLGYAWAVMLPLILVSPSTGTAILGPSTDLRSGFTFVQWGPLVITNGVGSFGWVRLSQLGGEPGTWALLASMGFLASWTCFAGRTRLWIATGTAAAFLGSQSTGAWIAALAAIAALGLVLLVFARLKVVQGTVLICVILAALPLATLLVDLKVLQNTFSLTARGIGFVAGISSTSVDPTRINLATSLQIDGLLISGVPLLALAVYLLLVRKSRIRLVFGLFVGAMLVFVQPSTMHPSIWLGLSMLAMQWRSQEGKQQPDTDILTAAARATAQGSVPSS